MFPPCQIVTRFSPWFLFIIFFSLPYFVDVAYCEDLSPSHFAQALRDDGEDIDPSKTKAGVSYPVNPGLSNRLWRGGVDIEVPWNVCQAQALVFPQHVLLAPLPSRPPPILKLH